MIIVAAALFIIAALEGAALFGTYHHGRQREKEHARLWRFVEELEADKRALTESLCRAEGKPFIPVARAERQPSDGWFDAKPEIKVADPRRAS